MRIQGMLKLFAVLALAAVPAACDDDGTSSRKPQPPGSVTGRVTAEGAGVAGVQVRLTKSGTDSVRTAETAADGAFQFTQVPAGSYQLAALLPSGLDAPAPAAVTVQSGAATIADVQVTPVRKAEVTVAPGTSDSVALASGVVVSVSPAGGPVTLTVEQRASTRIGELDLVAPAIAVTAAGGASGARASGPRAAGEISVKVWQRVPTCTGTDAGMAFEVTTAGGSPVFLFTQASCTTFTDPRTGKSSAAYLTETDVGSGATLGLGVFTKDSRCTGGERALYPLPGAPENASLTPLILIHGWQPMRLRCASLHGWTPETETFGALAQALRADPAIAGKYQVYVLRYPTFEPIANASAFLREEVVRRKWEDRDIAIVGHSMGGLVGRGYVAAHGASRVRALVTLGTPHLGSPLARDGVAQLAAIYACGAVVGGIPAGVLGALAKGVYPESEGYHDLAPNSPWITALADQRAGADRIYTLAGRVGVTEVGAGLLFPQCVLSQLDGAGTAGNDGVVPVGSATPSWTTLQHVVTENHLSITGGTAIPRVREILGRLAVCRPGGVPEPPAANAFPLSGTLARLPGGRVDVVLNPIVVGGAPQRGLTADNFAIVENGCLKDFTITTDEGTLGADLVFIQDMSGSMGNEITGVRNSVLSFAAQLEERGLSVRIGSVGFSGHGTIVTHPNAAGCEALGPVQDLTSPAAFRSHVAATWSASGGCDGPENALEAVEYAHRTVGWRPGAARVYILITDVSMHTSGTSCNGGGPCTDQTIESIVELIGSTSTVHAVAPADAFTRTASGGADPWLLAERTGGAKAVLPGSGVLDLNALGITDRIADIVRLTFTSTSDPLAAHRIRVRVQVNGQVSELSPGLVNYDLHPSLRRPWR